MTPPSGYARPHDARLAAELIDAGFELEIGFWGIRLTLPDAGRLLERGVAFIEGVLTSALALGSSVAAAEGYLPGYERAQR